MLLIAQLNDLYLGYDMAWKMQFCLWGDAMLSSDWRSSQKKIYDLLRLWTQLIKKTKKEGHFLYSALDGTYMMDPKHSGWKLDWMIDILCNALLLKFLKNQPSNFLLQINNLHKIMLRTWDHITGNGNHEIWSQVNGYFA